MKKISINLDEYHSVNYSSYGHDKNGSLIKMNLENIKLYLICPK